MTKRWHPRLVDTRTRARDTPAPHPPADPTMRRVTSPSRLSPHDWASALLAGPAVEPPPPYTGAIHDEFAWHVVKYLADDAVLRSEHAVEPGDRLPGALFTFATGAICVAIIIAFCHQF